MASAIKEQIRGLSSVVNASREFGESLDVSYDKEADVLYVSFGKPRKAVDSDFADENIIVREDEQGNPIGYTILDASRSMSS